MKRFVQLSRNEMKKVLGGYAPPVQCTATCSSSYSVICKGANCSATDYEGCKASTTDSNGNVTHDDKSCAIA
jgi:hypothetical protein